MDDGAPLSTPVIDATRPHQARLWNHWLGGKDTYPIDREVGDRIAEVYPEIADVARQSRAFLVRVVHFMTGQGIRQFLDVGTGLPAVDNTHEVAQRDVPGARVVYVDNDPLVVTHARALLTAVPDGTCAYIEADVRAPEAIIEQAAAVLDLSEPVGLLLLGIVGNVPDEDDPPAIVRRLVEVLPSGSLVAINDGTNVLGVDEWTPAEATARGEALRLCARAGTVPYHARTPQYIEALFDGLELVEPGVVSTPLWRPDFPEIGEPRPIDSFGGVARRP
ncbi:SAM-dependent methyltransferase [Actinomadura rubrisoli]|uniref:SAM-dependent methyltransferase n=1 Tax=Actinomadura rubrisoli TaxID=2530368 RepID=A0A4R5AAK5_9ACTN|nr:SAM-dependent methyltransferase [Actinomadura rubrisoli]TDD68695.1 SAM-dependent methyltransferase [Actinomadura rubrisoli]